MMTIWQESDLKLWALNIMDSELQGDRLCILSHSKEGQQGHLIVLGISQTPSLLSTPFTNKLSMVWHSFLKQIIIFCVTISTNKLFNLWHYFHKGLAISMIGRSVAKLQKKLSQHKLYTNMAETQLNMFLAK